jgi:uncharacterized protein with HEPN domain
LGRHACAPDRRVGHALGDQRIQIAGVAWDSVDVARSDPVIGEVAKRLTPATMATMPEVKWRDVRAIREVIAHDYDEVDVEILASIVRDDLPALRTAVGRALID